MQLEEKVISIIKENLEEPKEEITPQTDLRKDVEIDSFGTLMIINALEDEFSITLNESEFKDINTVSDIVKRVEELLMLQKS